jgi:hypothetical protein
MSMNVIIQVAKSSKTEMGRVCGMYGAEEMCLLDFYGETRGKESTCIT